MTGSRHSAGWRHRSRVCSRGPLPPCGDLGRLIPFMAKGGGAYDRGRDDRTVCRSARPPLVGDRAERSGRRVPASAGRRLNPVSPTVRSAVLVRGRGRCLRAGRRSHGARGQEDRPSCHRVETAAQPGRRGGHGPRHRRLHRPAGPPSPEAGTPTRSPADGVGTRATGARALARHVGPAVWWGRRGHGPPGRPLTPPRRSGAADVRPGTPRHPRRTAPSASSGERPKSRPCTLQGRVPGVGDGGRTAVRGHRTSRTVQEGGRP